MADLLQRARGRAASQRLIAGDRQSELSALIALIGIAALSTLIYLLVFTLPYSLPKWYNWIRFDVEGLQWRDKEVHWVQMAALFVQMGLYGLAWMLVRRLQSRAAWAIVILGALLPAAALIGVYPFGSTDIFDYIMHGRMLGVYHANPYVRLGNEFRYDLYYQYMGWPNAPSAYGPLWELPAGWLAKTVSLRWGAKIIPNVIAFKLLVSLFLVASGILVALILRRAAPERALSGVMLFTWSPVVLWETVGNGHQDIVMVFWILLAVYAILCKRYTLGVVALVAGTLVKFIPVLMIPAAGLIALRDLPNWRRRTQFVVSTAAISLGLVLICYAPFWAGPEVLSVERRAKLYMTSLPTVIAFVLQPRLGWEKATQTISLASTLLTGAFAIFEGVRGWRDRSWSSFTRSAFDIVIFYLMFTALWVWPWYAVWALALGVLLQDRRAVLAQIVTLALMTRPWIAGWLMLNRPAHVNGFRWDQMRLAPAIFALPWLYTAYLAARFLLGSSRREASAPRKREAPG